MRQWLRECRLIGVDAESKGLDLSPLRFSFEIRKTTTPTPNNAKIRVYNLSVKTAKQAKEEYKRIQLTAGYTGSSDVIFDGNIIESRHGRERVNTYLDILAGDGDEAYTRATVNQTLAAGAKYRDVFDAAFAGMNAAGVSLGQIDAFDTATYPRGRVLFGMARSFIETLCLTGNKYWSIQNQKLQVLDHKNTLPGEAFVISEDTGMVGIPEEVNEGLRVRCLLNPKLRVDGQVKIESKHISDIAKSASGFYRILEIVYVGDTEDTDWYADLTCVAMDKSGGGTVDSEGRYG